MDFTKITLRFENCENIEIPKEYIKDLRWVLDENNKCTLFYVRFKKNMVYSEYWSIHPGLNEELNKDPNTGKLFKRLRYGDICNAWIDYEDGTHVGFKVPIEPDTDLFYKPNPWQFWNSKTKTLLIKDGNYLDKKSIEEKSMIFGVLQWLKEQPEMKNKPVTDSDSIFYHVAPIKYAELIARYLSQNADCKS